MDVQVGFLNIGFILFRELLQMVPLRLLHERLNQSIDLGDCVEQPITCSMGIEDVITTASIVEIA